jgi:hypothetical protein
MCLRVTSPRPCLWKSYRPTNHHLDEPPPTVEVYQAMLPPSTDNYDTKRSHIAVDDYGYMIPDPGTVKDPCISPKTVPVRARTAPEPVSLSATTESTGYPRVSSKTTSMSIRIELGRMLTNQTTENTDSTDEATSEINLADEEEEWEHIENDFSVPKEVATVKDSIKRMVTRKPFALSALLQI